MAGTVLEAIFAVFTAVGDWIVSNREAYPDVLRRGRPYIPRCSRRSGACAFGNLLAHRHHSKIYALQRLNRKRPHVLKYVRFF